MDEYGVTAKAYLRRARLRLMEDDPASLFYAAMELKACVEARLGEYVEHLKPFRGKKLKIHNVKDNARKIRSISKGELISSIGFRLPSGVQMQEYHTPVPGSLKVYAESRLDSLRHAQSVFRLQDDDWWCNTKRELLEQYRSAWFACQGKMMVPPLFERGGKGIHPFVFDIDDSNREILRECSNMVGYGFVINVNYHDPSELGWTPDL